MFRLQPIHLVVVLIVALIIFGPKRLPQLGRWIGRAFTEFRKGAREMADSIKDESTRATAESQSPPGSGSAPGASAVSTAPSDATAPGASASTGSAGPGAGASASPADASPYSRIAAGNFCSQCGVANTADARFCNKCGTKLPA